MAALGSSFTGGSLVTLIITVLVMGYSMGIVAAWSRPSWTTKGIRSSLATRAFCSVWQTIRGKQDFLDSAGQRGGAGRPRLGTAHSPPPHSSLRPGRTPSSLSLSVSTSSASSSPGVQILQIGYEEMERILAAYEERGRVGTNLVIMDVRNAWEIEQTGPLSPAVHHLPLPLLLPSGQVLAPDYHPDDFVQRCGFEKPTFEETLVFTCAAGVRSQQACLIAAQAGYRQLVNYRGGSHEWFQYRTLSPLRK